MLSNLKNCLCYACCLWLLIEGAITASLSDAKCHQQLQAGADSAEGSPDPQLSLLRTAGHKI